MKTAKIKSDNQFPVVGIGASAGGLDAFKKLLKVIPENSGMAFVLVQHLDPKHKSLLPELLQKATNIPVLEISDKIKVEPNHIYVIPSDKMMVADDGVLKLTQRPSKIENKQNLPIDLFFTSLAEVHQSHAIGVVLSGSASDGTLGLKAIKDHGGITFAQDNETASFDSMPNSAVKAGVVDFILSPDKIPGKIIEITKKIQITKSENQNLLEQEEDAIRKIISLLRLRKGTDFTHYKQTTVRRRILRRMILSNFEILDDYINNIKENKNELDILYQDLLIPVTDFFRDESVYVNLCESVFPLIVKDKTKDETIRIWVAGCSTGEEAYSIAICFKEFLSNVQSQNPEKKIQIFATDLSEPAIEKARIGNYTVNELSNVSPERLKNYFVKNYFGYKVKKEIRELCVFAKHNLLKDPPFGKMDFISCRNVLIYMELYLQKKALTTFHYALNQKGFLLLGKSETTSSVPGLFISTDKYYKLFLRKDVSGKFVNIVNQYSEQNLINNNSNHNKENTRNDYLKIAEEIILRKYTPAGVIINEAMDIVHFRGNTFKYLEQQQGKPNYNLLKMAKQGLGFELRNLLHKVKKEIPSSSIGNQSLKKENISLQIDDSLHYVTIEVIPLPNTLELYNLILFHDTNKIVNKLSSNKIKKGEKEIRIQQLENELILIHEDMRSITEDQEATNEELQSDNEELLSTSEELQSLNEELETSKEELQSSNEELVVVNQEIVNLNEQIMKSRDYAEAIVDTIHEPIIILDKDLRIKSANKSFYKNFLVSEKETVGMLLYELGNKQWNIPSLTKLLKNIFLNNTYFYDYEIKHNFPEIGEKIMLLNASLLLQEIHGEQLILLAINDATEVRIQALELQRVEKELLKQDISANKIEKVRLQIAVKERTLELTQLNQELVAQYVEKEKRAAELNIANKELAFQNDENEKRASDLLTTNKELSAFTYIASHDLQEPLRKTQLFISRILDNKEQPLSEKNIDYFKKIQASSNRMQVLINDLLDYSRVTDAIDKFEKVNLNKIMDSVLQELTLAESIEETHTTIHLGKLPVIQGISFQIKQLFTNLISNSIKYNEAGRPVIIDIKSVIVSGKDIPNKKVNTKMEYNKISVSDNGMGFEQQYAKKIFTLFQRLHDKQSFSGTGIGLAICKKVLENHNGFIEAVGKPHEGATFNVFFPVLS